MSADTPRQYLTKEVKKLLPQSWVFYEFGTLPDSVQKVSVVLSLQGGNFTPETPISGALDAEFVLHILVPMQFGKAAEDQLEDNLLDLMFALRRVPNVRAPRFERGSINGTNPGFDVSFTLTTTN